MRKCLVVLIVLSLLFSVFVGFDSISFAQQKPIPGMAYELKKYEEITGKKIAKFNEAPMLAELVKQGKLPPVEKRLPQNPLVIEPIEEIGQYGGTWRQPYMGRADRWVAYGQRAFEYLFMFDKNGKVYPNLVESYKVSKDRRKYTLTLRKGVKWSDGHPLTTEDIMFSYEEVLLNKDLYPTTPAWFTVAGKPGVIKKIDEYTFEITFSEPYGIFPEKEAYFGFPLRPAHYMKQFHIKYTDPKQLETMIKEAKLQYWYQLFTLKAGWLGDNPEYPVLTAWKFVSIDPAGNMTFERNPYYWKIDPDGNQLPYIDRWRIEFVQDVQMFNMKVLQGEADCASFHIDLSNYTLFMENRQKGDYRVLKWPTGDGAMVTFMINQDVKDPILRKLFRDKRFRQALSLAIDREEINKLFAFGLAKPRQASLVSFSPYYDSSWEKSYAEYNPAKANEILDSMGLKRGSDGYRLRPDGKPLELVIELTDMWPVWVDVAQLTAQQYWKAIGIKTTVKVVERTLLGVRVGGGEHQITIWNMDRAVNPIVDPCYLVPYRSGLQWAPLSAMWYVTKGKGGERPSAELIQLQKLMDQLNRQIDEKNRFEIMKKIIELHKNNIWMIGTVGEQPQLVIVKNNFRNVPESLVFDEILRYERIVHPCHFFFKK
jgi:peptide/nickel transport system substrate-binding protein